MADKLTQKQEAFAQKYIELDNASEAYRQCYDVSEDAKPETIWSRASELCKNGKVAARIVELQLGHADRHNVTIDSLTKELDEARLVATEEKQPAAMTGATMGKAKLHGLLVDKAETKIDATDTFAALVLKAVDGKTRTT
tara:strand:+ start:2618 stop:3037 length:420 start_codon:yes stop_codon:yes gene_type:complete